MPNNISRARLRAPFWLNGREITAIDHALTLHEQVRTLNIAQQQKVAALLFSIAYAEKWAVRRSTWIVRCAQKIVYWVPGCSFFFRTLGTLNFNVCHAPSAEFSRRKFRKILRNDRLGIPFVIDHLIKQIGLEKPPSFILAEYQLNPLATTIAALQRGLNTWLSGIDFPSISEDGFLGKETLRVLIMRQQREGIEFPNLESRDAIHAYLQTFGGEKIEPFIPKYKEPKNLRSVFSVLSRSVTQPRAILKVIDCFRGPIDLSTYIADGLEAYRYVLKD